MTILNMIDERDPLSALEQAGLRLDAASMSLELAGAFGTLNPQRFGDAEDEYLTAMAAYRDQLRAVTGEDPEITLRRLAK